MSEYSKRLHVRKRGTEETIKLYTTTTEVGGSPYLAVRDGTTVAYVKLGTTSDSKASSLRVRKNGTVHAILRNAAIVPGSQSFEGSRGKFLCDETFTFIVPAGVTKIKATFYWYRDVETGTDFFVENTSNNNYWFFLTTDPYGDYVKVYETIIVAVTAGKTYSMIASCGELTFSWSETINAMTATVIDL